MRRIFFKILCGNEAIKYAVIIPQYISGTQTRFEHKPFKKQTVNNCNTYYNNKLLTISMRSNCYF